MQNEDFFQQTKAKINHHQHTLTTNNIKLSPSHKRKTISKGNPDLQKEMKSTGNKIHE